jgi:hypothetical protein
MLKAKTIMPNKFWILENTQGIKQGTMCIAPDPIQPNAVKVILNNEEKTFVDVNAACWDMAINIDSDIEIKDEIKQEDSVQGYPTKCPAFNPIWDIKRKIPVFTKRAKSSTLHAAGYYIINFDTGWVQSFCPKVSTLDQNQFKGPFKDKLEMREQLRITQNACDFN